MTLKEQLESAQKYVGKTWMDTRLKNYVVEVERAFINDANEVILALKGKQLGCTVVYANEYFKPAE